MTLIVESETTAGLDLQIFCTNGLSYLLFDQNDENSCSSWILGQDFLLHPCSPPFLMAPKLKLTPTAQAGNISLKLSQGQHTGQMANDLDI